MSLTAMFGFSGGCRQYASSPPPMPHVTALRSVLARAGVVVSETEAAEIVAATVAVAAAVEQEIRDAAALTVEAA